MTISSLKDFYKNKDSKNINLYKEYLMVNERHLNDAIQEAANLLGEDDPSVVRMQNQRTFIRTMKVIIDSSTREVMLNSLNKISNEELIDIINASVERLERDRDKVNEELEGVVNKRDKEYKEYLKVMQMQGYSDSYYQIEDSKEFFSEILSASNYILKLITSNMDKETLKRDIFGTLYQIDSINDKLAEMIISLRKIARVSDAETLKKAILVFLRPDKVGKIIGLDDENECYKTFALIQKEVKMKTKFYKALAVMLQKDIANNGFDSSSTYKRLAAIYEDYLKNGKVTVPENADIAALNAEIERLENIISGYDSKINYAKSTRESRQQMEELIRTMISAVPFEEGWNISKVGESVNKKRKAEAERKAKYDDLKKKSDYLAEITSLIKAILEGDKLERDMQIVDAGDENAKFEEEEKLEAFREIDTVIDAEKRRYRQFEILSQAIYELNDIKAKIDDVNKSRNLFKNITGANRMLKDELIEQYRKTVTKYYNQLKSEGLLLILVAKNYEEKEAEVKERPESFDALMGVSEVPALKPYSSVASIRQYHFADYFIADLQKRNILLASATQEKVNDNWVTLCKLARRLFTTSKNIDGLYEFQLSDAEISLMMTLQQDLVAIYEDLKKSRDDDKAMARATAMNELSEEFIDLMNQIGLKPYSVSREDIYNKHRELSGERYDINNQALELSDEATNAIEDCEPFDMLEGFGETVISADYVKKTVRL